ncbi:MAG TPA: cysteine desulfurase-like protein [Longimicrobiaceae bacterium]|nr:cysteine desulfurase-like protein [Longimicrobiaceae bacterium]
MSHDSFAALVRSHFPVFERRFGGRPLALLDAPAGSQVPRVVAEAVAGCLLFHNANLEGAFPTSREADALVAGAREAAADFLGAGSPAEISFGANMTTLTFAFARALAQGWGPGDEVVVTDLDHQANVAPWRRAAEDRGVAVRSVPFDPMTLQLDYAALEGMLSPRTRLVAVGAASNAVGTINDVPRVVELARRVGALVFVDAVHYAPHRPVDVRASGCDFLACSAYKFFGPHLGMLWGKREHMESLSPYKVPPCSDVLPERWETGTMNHEAMAGVAAAVNWIASLAPGPASTRREAVVAAMERIGRYEAALFDLLLDGLEAIPGVRVFGPPRGAPRTPTAGFTVRGVHADEVAARLGEEGVCVWSGNFYATGVVEGLALVQQGGLVRAGVAPYCTGDDVRRLVEGVARIASGVRRRVAVAAS